MVTMGKEQTKITKKDREFVQTLLDSKAVNFDAIGAAIAKFGPSIALTADGEDNFCWTMRRFIIFYRRPDPFTTRLEELAALRAEVGPEIQG